MNGAFNMAFTVTEIARQLGGEVIGDGSVMLHGFAPASSARQGDLTFAENETYLIRAEASAASAILVDGEAVSSSKALIRVGNARIAFAKALSIFFPEPVYTAGIHPTAVVDPSAEVDASARIGAYCIIQAKARIGPRVVLHGHNFIGEASQLGEATQLFANVVLYPRTEIGRRCRIHSGAVIGSDGFGYVLDGQEHRKVPQVGNVIIQDDVEIGANVTIDRGALGPTLVGRGTKIDNLVQLGHNVSIGEHCLLVAQVGIAGSTRIGNYSTLAGQAGLAGHLKIGDRVVIAAQSGVMHDIPSGERWLGAPARPDRQMKRQFIAMQQLPDWIRRIQEMERRLEKAESQLEAKKSAAMPLADGNSPASGPAVADL
jgi:UDP-3-O-[3-hydroxymyristoyl] glucosamine N-acyltransferase